MLTSRNQASNGHSGISLHQANRIKRVSLRIQANPLLYFPEHLRLLFDGNDRLEALIQFKALMEVTPWRAEDILKSTKMVMQSPPANLAEIMHQCGVEGVVAKEGESRYSAYLEYLKKACADWENVFQNHSLRCWYPKAFEPIWSSADSI